MLIWSYTDAVAIRKYRDSMSLWEYTILQPGKEKRYGEKSENEKNRIIGGLKKGKTYYFNKKQQEFPQPLQVVGWIA